MAGLLIEARDAASAARQAGQFALDAGVLDDLVTRYRALAAAGLAANLYRRTATAKDARRIARRFLSSEDLILRFVTRPDLDIFSNNEAERTIRPVKVQQRTSGGSWRTIEGLADFALVQSCLSTACKWGISKLDALRDLFNRRAWLPPGLEPAGRHHRARIPHFTLPGRDPGRAGSRAGPGREPGDEAGTALAAGCPAMTALMVYAGTASGDAEVTRTGGIPLVPAVFSWPACRRCEGPMQFLAQVMLGDLGMDEWRGVLAVFMCQNDPGMCDEWDAVAGGNQALILPAGGLVPAAVPAGPATVLGEVSAVQYVTLNEDYDQARQAWPEREGRPGRDVLGQLGGQPSWVQADETPACPECAKPMSFVIQLEEGHDYRTAANFGSGCGYGFACQPCGTAAFLWQR